MSIIIKTPEQIEKMRIACRLAADVLEMIKPHVVAGVTTEKLNTLCHDFIVKNQQAISAPLNYHGFPKSICTSINHVVCHGIPTENKKLKNGDIINIDITVIKDGYHGDSSRMFLVDEPNVLARRLCRVTYESLMKGIDMVKPGIRLGDIGHTIQQHTRSQRFTIVREFCGHGIGEGFHEDPQVLHYGTPGTREKLEPGMIFTIEPMLNAGKSATKVLSDGWTVVTRDKSLSAQYEHTVLVTETGHEIMTIRQEEIDGSFTI